MRRGVLVLVLGLVGAMVAYGWVYFAGTARPRALMRSAQPELAWLKHEFNLSDLEFARVSELHARYLPECRERCRRIDELNGILSNALTSGTAVTAQVEKLLGERAHMRAQCQIEMLKHFFAVSRTMPPEQGRRYLAWVMQNTCLREPAMDAGAGHHAGMDMSVRQP